jgi:hypothetical protein
MDSLRASPFKNFVSLLFFLLMVSLFKNLRALSVVSFVFYNPSLYYYLAKAFILFLFIRPLKGTAMNYLQASNSLPLALADGMRMC